MKLARDGIPTVTFLALATAAFALVSPVPAAVMAVLAVLVIWFYRDPDRTAPEGDGLFVSPADGRVVEISEAEHPFTGPSVKVGIFMNVLSVHVNRAPCMGRVDYLAAARVSQSPPMEIARPRAWAKLPLSRKQTRATITVPLPVMLQACTGRSASRVKLRS